MTDLNVVFSDVKPVFLEGLQEENSIHARFRASVNIGNVTATTAFIAARSIYRLTVNGRFVSAGPARTAEGYLRADEIDITDYLSNGVNVIDAEVISYGHPFGAYSNDFVLGKGVLMCAVWSEEGLIAATGRNFEGYLVKSRKQVTERISHCRQSAENYDLRISDIPWKVTEAEKDFTVIARRSYYPDYTIHEGKNLIKWASVRIDSNIEASKRGFDRNIELDESPVIDFKRTVAVSGKGEVHTNRGRIYTEKFPKDESFYLEFDFEKPLLGFIGIEFECEYEGIADIAHFEFFGLGERAEGLTDGANPFTRIHTVKGKNRFLTMEPALFRYLRVYFRECGNISGLRVYETDYCTPDLLSGGFSCSDDSINRLFEAAKLTYRLNTLDIFMDCPDRERGGWLCDSLWTSRASRMLSGDAKIEQDFIENFLLTDPCKMWKGFFPEVYPASKADFLNSPGITTWTFWLMIELCEFVERSGEKEWALGYKKRIDAFVEGALSLIGGSGLFENLPNVFVDWSLSNNPIFDGPISTVANALFAKALDLLGKLYGEPSWCEKAQEMRKILRSVLLVRKDGPGMIPDSLFVDGNGKICERALYTESCQYTVVWSDLFTEEEIPRLKFNIINKMGFRPKYGADTYLGRANLFIGLCIRFDVLAKFGAYERLMEEFGDLYGQQLREGPGTLWETVCMEGNSRCHGFNSHAAVQLMRDILGIGIPDEEKKTVAININPCGIRWAKGTVNTRDGIIALSWSAEDGNVRYDITLPEGWKAV